MPSEGGDESSHPEPTPAAGADPIIAQNFRGTNKTKNERRWRRRRKKRVEEKYFYLLFSISSYKSNQNRSHLIREEGGRKRVRHFKSTNSLVPSKAIPRISKEIPLFSFLFIFILYRTIPHKSITNTIVVNS